MTSTEDLINITIEKKINDKVKSIDDILKPWHVISSVLGTGIARPLNWSKALTYFLRLINFSICTTIVVYGAIDFFFFENVFKSDTFKIMYYSNKVVCYISSYCYVFYGIVQYSKWPILIEKIRIIDRKMQQGGMENDNRLIKKFQIFSLIVTIVLGPFSLLCHALYYYYVRPEDLFASDLLLYHTIAQSLAMNFSFDLIVLTIYCRFKAVNRRMAQITDQFTAGIIVTEIRRVREIHHAICNLVRLVNDIHGVHLLLSSLNSFTMVVATLFRIYMGVVEGKNIFIMINNIIWLVYTAQLAITCFVCNVTCRQSLKMSLIMHEIVTRRMLKSPFSYDLYSVNISSAAHDSECSLRREITEFSSQLYHCNVSFSACEFFTIDNKLLRSFIGVITTYLIILVQFYVPEKGDESEIDTTTATVTATSINSQKF